MSQEEDKVDKNSAVVVKQVAQQIDPPVVSHPISASAAAAAAVPEVPKLPSSLEFLSSLKNNPELLKQYLSLFFNSMKEDPDFLNQIKGLIPEFINPEGQGDKSEGQGEGEGDGERKRVPVKRMRQVNDDDENKKEEDKESIEGDEGNADEDEDEDVVVEEPLNKRRKDLMEGKEEKEEAKGKNEVGNNIREKLCQIIGVEYSPSFNILRDFIIEILKVANFKKYGGMAKVISELEEGERQRPIPFIDWVKDKDSVNLSLLSLSCICYYMTLINGKVDSPVVVDFNSAIKGLSLIHIDKKFQYEWNIIINEELIFQIKWFMYGLLIYNQYKPSSSSSSKRKSKKRTKGGKNKPEEEQVEEVDKNIAFNFNRVYNFNPLIIIPKNQLTELFGFDIGEYKNAKRIIIDLIFKILKSIPIIKKDEFKKPSNKKKSTTTTTTKSFAASVDKVPEEEEEDGIDFDNEEDKRELETLERLKYFGVECKLVKRLEEINVSRKKKKEDEVKKIIIESLYSSSVITSTLEVYPYIAEFSSKDSSLLSTQLIQYFKRDERFLDKSYIQHILKLFRYYCPLSLYNIPGDIHDNVILFGCQLFAKKTIPKESVICFVPYVPISTIIPDRRRFCFSITKSVLLDDGKKEQKTEIVCPIFQCLPSLGFGGFWNYKFNSKGLNSNSKIIISGDNIMLISTSNIDIGNEIIVNPCSDLIALIYYPEIKAIDFTISSISDKLSSLLIDDDDDVEHS